MATPPDESEFIELGANYNQKPPPKKTKAPKPKPSRKREKLFASYLSHEPPFPSHLLHPFELESYAALIDISSISQKTKTKPNHLSTNLPKSVPSLKDCLAYAYTLAHLSKNNPDLEFPAYVHIYYTLKALDNSYKTANAASLLRLTQRYEEIKLKNGYADGTAKDS